MTTTSDMAQRFGSRLGSISVEDVLSALGLEPRRTTVQMTANASAWFAAGLLVGAGVALWVAPRATQARGIVGSGPEGSQTLTQM